MALAGVLLPSAAAGAQPSRYAVSGGLTTVAQWVDDDRVRAEWVSSLDLFVDVALGGRVRLETYVEANTTPFRNGVSTLVGEANTDAGTALNGRREGRVQLSEVRLVVPLGEGSRVHGGLLDATHFLDVSRIANDENLFFLGVPFVNNPTIEFPDYALGAALDGAIPGTDSWRVGAVVTSSHGLADNPGVSYAQLLSVDEPDKGVFAGLATRWVGEGRRLSLGGWVHTAPHDRLDGAADSEANWGLFSVAGWFRGPHAVSARVGLANPEISVDRLFTGLTYLWARTPDAVGVAVGRSAASPDAIDAADVVHGELFVRRRLFREVFATGSLQRIHNPGFDDLGRTVDSRLWIVGLRLSMQF